jgi:hypothetical protein
VRRLGFAALAVGVLLALGVAPAGADGDPNKGGVSKDGDDVDLWSRTGQDIPGQPGAGNSRSAAYDPNAYICRYVSQVNSEGYEFVATPPAGSSASTGASMNEICGRAKDVLAALGQADPAGWFVNNCTAGPEGCGATYGVWVRNAQPSPAQLAQILRDRLAINPPQTLHTSPDSDRLYVRFPTWFWFTGGSEAAPPPERIGPVEVRATPRFEWSTGEGNVTCPDSGTPYDAARYAANAESPTCGHTYQRPGRYTLTLTVTWTFTWYLNGVPQDDSVLAPTVYTVSQDIDVNEIQGIVTDTR